MANNEIRSWASNLMPLLLALLSLGSLTFLSPRDLRSGRPDETTTSPPGPAKNTPHLNVRLWEDPFAELSKIDSAQAANITTLGAMEKPRTARGEELAPLILGVTLPDGDSVLNTERRLRYRYALQAAMNAARYEPVGRGELGIINVAPDLAQGGGVPASPWLVPYEWFLNPDADAKTPGAQVRPVLVLWLSESHLTHYQHNLYGLMIKASQQLCGFGALIGPTTSDGLINLNLEWHEHPNYLEANIPVYSFSATATAETLRPELKLQLTEFGANPSGPEPQPISMTFGLPLVRRLTPLDNQICNVLLQELALRHIPLPLKANAQSVIKTRIVMLGEWDSVYSRALRTTFETALKALAIAKKQVYAPEAIEWYSFLGGVETGGSNPATSAKKAPDATSLLHPDASNAPHAYGREQLDYLDRLAKQLRDANRDTPVVAVGIFSSDVFDKISLLEALRDDFPGAAFFTTSLDAEMLDPRHSQWTRNLIVASPFGLSLEKTVTPPLVHYRVSDLSTIPFRATNQTAMLYSVLAALDEMEGATAPSKPSKFRPRVYEIGRLSAVDLTAGTSAPVWSYDEETWFMTVAAAIVAGLAWWLHARLREWRLEVCKEAAAMQVQASALYNQGADGQPRAKWRPYLREWLLPATWIILCFGVGLSLRFAIELDALSDQGEPWSLLEGVSAWPTEVLRVAGILLSIFFLGMMAIRLQTMKARLGRRFGLTATQAAVTEKPNLKPFWSKGGSVATAWYRFCRRLLSPARWLLIVGIGLLAGYILFHWIDGGDHPFFPARGPRINNLNQDYLMWIFAGSLTALVLMTGRIIFLVKLMIWRITQAATTWPWQTYWCDLIGAQYRLAPPIPARPGDLPSFLVGDSVMDPLYDIRFTGELTEFTGEFIIYPFVVLLFMLMARIPFLDQFNWTPRYILTLVCTFGILLCMGIILGRMAQDRRAKALWHFRNLITSTQAVLAWTPTEWKKFGSEVKCVTTNNKEAADKVLHQRLQAAQAAAKEIDELQTGAFAPFSQNPVLWALLTPLTGLGGVNLLHLFH